MKQKRRVLFICDALAPGGAERQMSLLIRHLPHEWEARVWSLADGPFARVLQNSGTPVDVSTRKYRFDILPAMSLWKILLLWKPDVVHCWGWMCIAAALPVCGPLHTPVISTIRTGCIRTDEGVVRGHARAFFARLAGRVIANSRSGLRSWNVPDNKGRVVYNAFDRERLGLCAPDKRTLPFTVIMAARMEPVKDYGAFLAAARSLAANRNRWRFIALGFGASRTKIIKSASALIADGTVRFPEPGMEILPFISRAHAGVLMTSPGILEGCSNSIMEYMACGLPVVCSDSGGNRELVIEGETGFLVPAGDFAALAERLQWLHDNGDRAAAMGRAGRTRILGEFSIGSMVDKTVAVYNELLEN